MNTAIALTFQAPSTPAVTPTAVPTMPTRAPWRTNMASMAAGVEPRVRRMAISPRLSRTTITSVETMLKAATPTTSSRITKMIERVSWIDRKKLPCSRVQSVT